MFRFQWNALRVGDRVAVGFALEMKGMTAYFLGDLDADSYHALMRRAIVGDHDPHEVVLMEIEPQKQKTWPDFIVTEQMWGVRAIDTPDVHREGHRLYYRRDGKATQIRRVYNRVIPDELERKHAELVAPRTDFLEARVHGHAEAKRSRHLDCQGGIELQVVREDAVHRDAETAGDRAVLAPAIELHRKIGAHEGSQVHVPSSIGSRSIQEVVRELEP